MSLILKKFVNKNKYSIYYYLSAVILIIAWFIFQTTNTVKIISLLGFVFTLGLYNIKEIKKETEFTDKFINWFNFGIFLIITIIFISSFVGEINTAITLTLILFFLILLSVTIFFLIILFKSKDHLIAVITLTAVLSILFIFLFGYIYTLTPIFSESKLTFTDSDENLESLWDYVYFSSSAFYGNAIGDIQPLGYNKLLMQIESGLSFIFHVIILGALVPTVGKTIGIKINKYNSP